MYLFLCCWWNNDVMNFDGCDFCRCCFCFLLVPVFSWHLFHQHRAPHFFSSTHFSLKQIHNLTINRKKTHFSSDLCVYSNFAAGNFRLCFSTLNIQPGKKQHFCVCVCAYLLFRSKDLHWIENSIHVNNAKKTIRSFYSFSISLSLSLTLSLLFELPVVVGCKSNVDERKYGVYTRKCVGTPIARKEWEKVFKCWRWLRWWWCWCRWWR